MVAGPPSPSLAEISRNTSVISSSSSSSSTSSLLDETPPRPTRTFAAPRSTNDLAQSQAHLLPSYIQRELGISPSPLRDVAGPAPSRARFNSPQDFEFGDILGHGSYSTVIQAKGKKSGRTYAIKVLDKAHLSRHNQRRTAYAEKEALVVLGLTHPGIVGLHSTFSDAWSLYFVLDCLPNGDLRALISRYGSLSLECTRYYTAQLTDAIQYIHSKGVMHRDIKPENLLLDACFRLALADFGTAKVLSDVSSPSIHPDSSNDTDSNTPQLQTLRRSNTFVGTPQYYSPELLAHSQTSTASDLWALGCVLFELYTGTFAFNGPSPLLTWRLIKALQYTFPEDFDFDAKDLVQQLLVTEPERRLGAGGEQEVNGMNTLKAHRFFATVDWDTIWEIPHPPLESGLKPPPEPVTAPTSDAELGELLREERLLEQDDDEITWAKDARIAAYLPGLRHANGGANGNGAATLVADDHPSDEGVEETDNMQQYVFPRVAGEELDGGLPYTSPPPPPAPTRDEGVAEVAQFGGAADAEKLVEAAAGLALEEPVVVDVIEGVPRNELLAEQDTRGADVRDEGSTGFPIGHREASGSTGSSSTPRPSSKPPPGLRVSPSATPPPSIPLVSTPAEFAHLLQPAETLLFYSPLIPDAHAPSFSRLLPKLLSGSVRSKPKLKERVLLLTNRRVLCVSTGKSAVVIKQEFFLPTARGSASAGAGPLIKAVEARGDRGLALLMSDKPFVYLLDDTAAPSKWVQQIRGILQTSEPLSGSVSRT